MSGARPSAAAASRSRAHHLSCFPILGIIIPNMGTLANRPSGAISPSTAADALFPSVQQRVLALLFGQPGRRFLSADLIEMVDSGTGATHRVVKRLAEAGLVVEQTEGRQKYYQANPESPVFEELVGLVRKTVGLVDPLRTALAPFADRVRAAFVYGSVAAGRERPTSDIDLMVVADDLDYPALFDALQPVERQLSRPVNPNLMTGAEWIRRRSEVAGFVGKLTEGPRLFVLGSDDDLR